MQTPAHQTPAHHTPQRFRPRTGFRPLVALAFLGLGAACLPFTSTPATPETAVPADEPADQPVTDSNFQPMPPPGDPQAAVRGEYDDAATKDTVAGWELFIARHPESPLAAKARASLAVARAR